MKEQNLKMWKDLNVVANGALVYFDGKNLSIMPLLQDILSKSSGHVNAYNKQGSVKIDEAWDDEDEDKINDLLEKKYMDYLASQGGRLVYHSSDGTNILFWDDGVVDIRLYGTYISFQMLTNDTALFSEVKEYFDEQWAPPEKSGMIYAIVKQNQQLMLSAVGNAGIPLVEGNYTPKVMEDYKFVIKDLQSESPCGRISIMTGVPGTGKTHLIRAMLLEVPDAMFVLISPEMITNLAGPELLPLLLQQRGSDTGPIILILEDADKCLVARDKDNINSIQSLLNLGDGILGSMLDLRIIATTNAQQLHMEEALMRPGRLSKMLEVGPLDLATAKGVFKRLLPNHPLPKELNYASYSSPHGMTPVPDFKMTIAEAYALARKYGWEPPTRKMTPSDEDVGVTADIPYFD